MHYTVISSTPSPYARKVRINLIEQGIPFTLQTEVPWDHDTQTPQYNPLEKLPVLIIRDSEADTSAAPRKVVYESNVIVDYLNTPGASFLPPSVKSLLPSAPDARIHARQIESLADGVADSMILWTFETRREEGKQSPEWTARQTRKIDGGLKALEEIVKKDASRGFLIGEELTTADVAVGSLVGFMALRQPDNEWKKQYPALEKYWKKLEERDSFKQTIPVMFTIKDKIV